MRLWTLDIAREQAPTDDHFQQYADLTRDAGFDGIGLYLEHRFAYPSMPWVAGQGAVTPEMVARLEAANPDLQIIPFINLLAHVEGFIYTEPGKGWAEERMKGLQACACNADFLAAGRAILEDTLSAFRSELIHLGGDETAQLGNCPLCKAKVEAFEAERPGSDGKARLFGEHFGPLCQRVIEAGRRPALWGDMILQHPEAAEWIPKGTLLFDWQYFSGCSESTRKLMDLGFEVVGCPALHTYNATWLHVDASEQNVRDVTHDVHSLGAAGVCVTTWECGMFGAYDTLFPALKACGQMLLDPEAMPVHAFLKAYEAESPAYAAWADAMGVKLAALGGTFTPGKIRSSLKTRLLLMGNPFLAWMHHAEEFSGESGEQALALFEEALRIAPNEACKGITQFARGAVEFVRLAEAARLRYAAGQPEAAIAKLAATRTIFDELERVAQRSVERIGGSKADSFRCHNAKQVVERVIQRIRHYGDGSLGYLPSFETITHPCFIPHDQGAWWRINRWAYE